MSTFKDNKELLLNNIDKIRSLNQKVVIEEKRIRFFAEKLRVGLSSMRKEQLIDDFNFDSHLCVLSYDPDYVKEKNLEEGDSIWDDNIYTLFNDFDDETRFSDNWNELPPEHTFGNEFFCYTMHCICFHSDLEWKDIIAIDDVLFDLKVEYQFFTNKMMI